jgi:hypothetical protein
MHLLRRPEKFAMKALHGIYVLLLRKHYGVKKVMPLSVSNHAPDLCDIRLPDQDRA